MKHLFFALSIALLTSSVATTAWSQQTEPTEQETKDFIVEKMSKCSATTEVKFEGSTLHLSTFRTVFTVALYQNFIVPVQKLESVEAVSFTPDTPDNGQSLFDLGFQCRGADGRCIVTESRGAEIVSENKESNAIKVPGEFIKACPHRTNEVLAKAFSHLIGIYDAKRPKPLFE